MGQALILPCNSYIISKTEKGIVKWLLTGTGEEYNSQKIHLY